MRRLFQVLTLVNLGGVALFAYLGKWRLCLVAAIALLFCIACLLVESTDAEE